MSIEGDWQVTLNTPMGAQEGTLKLRIVDDVLTGELYGALGSLPIYDASADGNTLKWKADLTKPLAVTLAFTASVDGDRISGKAKAGLLGSATFTGVRA